MAEGTTLHPTAPDALAPDLERRRTIRLVNYWLSLRWSGRGPFFRDFQPELNRVPWADSFLAYLGGKPEEISFEYVGDGIAPIFRPKGTNLPERDWLLEAIATRCGDIKGTLDCGRPAHRDGSFVLSDGSLVQYRSVLLPFVDEEHAPRYLLGAVTYRLQRPQAIVIPLRRPTPGR